MSSRVLVVEDEPLIRRLLAKILEREGIAIEECADGAAALERILAERFDVILLDLVLPHVSGCEIVARCASALSPPRPVVLVMTAFDGALRPALDPYIVTAVLMKPFDFQLLGDIIRDTVRGLDAAEDARAVPPFATVPPPPDPPSADSKW